MGKWKREKMTVGNGKVERWKSGKVKVENGKMEK